MISNFDIHSLENIIFKLTTIKISIFNPVSVAKPAGLDMTWLDTSKTGFLATKALEDCASYVDLFNVYLCYAVLSIACSLVIT